MRRIARWGLAACLSTLVMVGESVATTELTADHIVENNVAARGGLEAWRKIQSMAWVGHIERTHANAPNLPFVLELKRPNKTRFEIRAQNQTAVRVFDGSNGWKQRPTAEGRPELQPYTTDELRFAAEAQGIDGPLVDYQAKGIAVALEGVDEIEGRRAYRLNVKLPSGASHHVWIDAQTFLDVKYDRLSRDAFGKLATMSVFYRNYKTIEGLQIPMVIESGADTGRATDRMVIDTIVLNPPLPDLMFAKPGAPGRGNLAAVNREPPRTARPPRLVGPQSATAFREAK